MGLGWAQLHVLSQPRRGTQKSPPLDSVFESRPSWSPGRGTEVAPASRRCKGSYKASGGPGAEELRGRALAWSARGPGLRPQNHPPPTRGRKEEEEEKAINGSK